MIIATFRIPKERLDLMQGHRKLMALLDSLSPCFKGKQWFRVPHSSDESKKRRIRCADEDAFLRQTARDMGEAAVRWPGTGEGYAALITSASDQESWEEPGSTVIDFSPRRGVVRIETFSPPGTPAIVYTEARHRFLMSCSQLDTIFANCDFPRSPRPGSSSGELYYGGDLQVFPHRDFVGWMGFVSKSIESRDVPEADEIIPMPEKGGTMIVAVADAFNVHNHDHVEKAQRVEMRLVDLDALPVTDPRFL